MDAKPELEPLDPRPLLLKRMIWDIFPHDPEEIRAAQLALGLVPDSDDVVEGGRTAMDIEHDASDVRVNRVSPMYTSLEYLSYCAAWVVGQYMIKSMKETVGDVELPPGFPQDFAEQNGQVIMMSVTAIVAHLMDTGVLAYGEKVTK